MKRCPSCNRVKVVVISTDAAFTCGRSPDHTERLPVNAVRCDNCAMTGPPGHTEDEAIENWDKLPRRRSLDVDVHKLVKQKVKIGYPSPRGCGDVRGKEKDEP